MQQCWRAIIPACRAVLRGGPCNTLPLYVSALEHCEAVVVVHHEHSQITWNIYLARYMAFIVA